MRTSKKHKIHSPKQTAKEKMQVYTVEVPWHLGQNGLWWNETCAMVLNVFGLPGDRFTSHPTPNKMSFYFKNEKDASLCKILLSERL